MISSGGNVLSPFSISFLNDGQDAVFTPYMALPDNATITVSVTGITDGAGNILIPFTASFQTRNGPVLSNVNVVYFNPPSAATGVPLNSTITLQFDNPVDPYTINTTTLPVMDLNAQKVLDGVWTLSSNAMLAILRPPRPSV